MTFTEQIIVAGADGSPGALPAIRWAAAEAQRRGATLILLNVFDPVWAADRNLTQPHDLDITRDRTEEIAANAEREARKVAPTATIRRSAVGGEPVPEILQAAETASLIVVGNPGHGGLSSLLLGSVGLGVATHARCPVVVSGRSVTWDGPVVVGVDGSAAGADAIGLAFDQAAGHGCPLLAVRAFRRSAPARAAGFAPSILRLDEDIAVERQTLRELLDPWRDKYPQVEVDEVVSNQDAADALVAASQAARLVVVGSSSLGSLAGALLGSVSLHLLHHVDCPIMIAR